MKEDIWGNELIKEVTNKLKSKYSCQVCGDEFIIFSDSSDFIRKTPLYSIGMGIVENSIEDAI